MHPHKQLKTAADLLDRLAEQLEAAANAQAKLASELAVTKATADKTVKQASAEKTASEAKAKAEIGVVAKQAAAAVKTAGLLSDDRQTDAFAAQLLDHKTALAKLAELTKYVGVQKRASVVVDGTAPQTASADDVFNNHARAVLARLGA